MYFVLLLFVIIVTRLCLSDNIPVTQNSSLHDTTFLCDGCSNGYSTESVTESPLYATSGNPFFTGNNYNCVKMVTNQNTLKDVEKAAAIIECYFQSVEDTIVIAEKFRACLLESGISLTDPTLMEMFSIGTPEECGLPETDPSTGKKVYKSRYQVICLLIGTEHNVKVHFCKPEGVKLSDSNTQEELMEYYRTACGLADEDLTEQLSQKALDEKILFRPGKNALDCLEGGFPMVDNIIGAYNLDAAITAVYVMFGLALFSSAIQFIGVFLQPVIKAVHLGILNMCTADMACIIVTLLFIKKPSSSFAWHKIITGLAFNSPRCETLSYLFIILRVYLNLTAVLQSYERYLAICHPIQYKIMNKGPGKVIKVFAITLIVAAVLGTMPYLYTRSSYIQGYENPDMCAVYTVSTLTVSILLGLPLAAWALLVQVLPRVVEIRLCVLSIRQLKKAHVFQGESVSPQQHAHISMSQAELKITWLLICHSVCYITCNSPETIYLFVLVMFRSGSIEFMITAYFISVVFPVVKVLVSLPFTIRSIEMSMALVRAKAEMIRNIFSSQLTSSTNDGQRVTQPNP